MKNVQIKLLYRDSKLPTKGNKTDACYDLYAHSVEISDTQIIYKLGFATAIPEGKMCKVYPRSSISKMDLVLANATGIIDSGYRDEWMLKFNRKLSSQIVSLRYYLSVATAYLAKATEEFKKVPKWNIVKKIGLKVVIVLTSKIVEVLENRLLEVVKSEKIYKTGDRIAQVELRDVGDIVWIQTKDLAEGDRGGGFGSTGD